MGIDYERELLPFLPHSPTLIVMWACAAVITGLFVWGLVRRVRSYRAAGRSLWADVGGAALPWGPRLHRALADIFVQTKVRERRLPAFMHVPLFYGMILLFIGTLIVLVYSDILVFFGEFTLGGLFYVIFEIVMDLAGLALIFGVAIALWRRLVTKPEYLTLKGSTLLILFGLLFMGLSGFGLEAYRIAAQPNEWAPAAFIGWSLSRLLTGVAEPTGTATVVYAVFWWLHAGAAFALIVGAAWSGFSHLWVLPASVAAHDPARPRTELTTPFNLAAAMESEEDIELVSGTAATADIAPVQRLAADACVACGRCHQECPAQAAGRPLSPRDLLQDVRATLGTDLGGHASGRAAADFEEAVWSCTNCYACEQACPARIRHVDYVLDFRRALVDQNRLDEQKLSMLAALDRNQNPYKLPSHERAAWLSDVPYVEQIMYGAAGDSDEPPEYLYWIGCSAAYDERSSLVARATMDLLRTAGVRFVTLGPAEPCCGEPAKRLGEEGRFQMMAITAIEMIKETGARKLVTHCPHGLNVFLHEYPSLGFTIPAVHHTELLAELVAAGRLRPAAATGEGLAAASAAAASDGAAASVAAGAAADGAAAAAPAGRQNVVYHEPCNLARAGRPAAGLDVLRAALSGAAAGNGAGGDVLLPERHGVQTFCCGGGGANSFYQVEREEQRISALRLDQLVATGARQVAVSCPFCLTMLRDAAGNRPELDVEIVDVAEALQRRIAAPQREAQPGAVGGAVEPG
jgi:Fe-S oxidoreductase/nitrate reductase gamma subunit